MIKTLAEKIFRQINYLVNSLVESLFSRNVCQKWGSVCHNVIEKFRENMSKDFLLTFERHESKHDNESFKILLTGFHNFESGFPQSNWSLLSVHSTRTIGWLA